MTIAIRGAGFLGGIGPGGGKVGGTSPGANGCPKDEGEGTRAGRWGCRGLRTGEAKRGWQTGTASYEHEGAENMSCMTARVPRVWEAMQDGDNAGCGLLRVQPGCCCGRIHVRRLALGMWGCQVAICPLDCLSNRVLQPVAETIKSDVLFMFYFFSN